MTKVKMRSLMAGPDGTRLPGKIYPVSPEEAKELIDGGYAESVKESAKPEASTSAPRAATRSRGRTASKQEADEANPAEADEAE